MKDAIVVVLLSASFATMVTAYLATLYGLAIRASPRLLLAAVVPILTPFAARRASLNVRATLFTIGAAVYGTLRLLLWLRVL